MSNSKKTYTCPMHPQVISNKPGRCPICGMALIAKDAAFSHSTSQNLDEIPFGNMTWKSYIPLVVIFGTLILTSITITLRDYYTGTLSIVNSISYFMIGFFLVFSSFKLMDIDGFAEGYSTYDVLAQRWFLYGYLYPFIELFFGLSMILAPNSELLLWSEIFIMVFSGVGVTIKLMRREKFQCACLGTFLKVPLTTITLVEDFGMAILAGVLLLLK